MNLGLTSLLILLYAVAGAVKLCERLAKVVQVLAQHMRLQVAAHSVENSRELQNALRQLLLFGMTDLNASLLQRICSVLIKAFLADARVSSNGANPGVGVEQVGRSVAFVFQHSVKGKDVVIGPVVRQVSVFDASVSN